MSSSTITPCGATPTLSTQSRITGTPVLCALPVEQLSGDPTHDWRGRLDHPRHDARGKPVERTGGRAAKVRIEDRHFGRTPAHLEVPKPTTVAVGFSEVQQAVAVGQLPADTDTALATRLLHAYVAGIMREWVLDKTAYDLEASAPAFVDMIMAGLLARPPRRAERVLPRVRPRAASAA